MRAAPITRLSLTHPHGLRTAIAGAFVMPARTSPRAPLWVEGYRALHAPFVALGTARRYLARLEAHEAAVLCVGRPARFRRLLTRVLGGQTQLKEVSPRWPLWDPTRFSSARAALVAVEVHPFVVSRFQAAGWLVCPDRVRWQGSLSAVPPAKPGNSLLDDLRRVRSRGYALQEAAGSRSDWGEFRQRMQIPYANQRFSEEAWLPGPLSKRALERRGKLLFVTEEGRRIAGVAVVCNRDEIWLASLGVRDGNLELVRAGAIAAIYALTISWARGIGMRRIDAGCTSAFEHDGLVQYKRKWGLRPVPEPLSHLVAMLADPSNEALRVAMEREPFWVARGEGWLEQYPGDLAAPPADGRFGVRLTGS